MGEYAVGAATRKRIYDVTKKLFYEKGIKATSYKDICEAAEVNRGLIPYYFKSKSNIAVQVLEEFVESMERAINERWPEDKMSRSEFNIMVELLMFRLLAENENVCRFYDEIRSEAEFRATTLRIQGETMNALVQGAGIAVDPAKLTTVVAMVEGTENELVHLVRRNLLEESIEAMVRRDVRCCYFLLGADLSQVDEAWERAMALAKNCTMKCDARFRCKIVEEAAS